MTEYMLILKPMPEENLLDKSVFQSRSARIQFAEDQIQTINESFTDIVFGKIRSNNPQKVKITATHEDTEKLLLHKCVQRIVNLGAAN